MINAEDLKIAIKDITEILLFKKIKFHITGGLASSFYGEPRLTQDIDIVLRLTIEESSELADSDFKKKFIIDELTIKPAIQNKSIFQALHEETMIKIDFHVGEAIEGELDRSKTVEILPSLSIPLVTVEDAILSKLIWIQKGSHKSRQDLEMMLKNINKLDQNYIKTNAEKLGISKLLSEFLPKE